MKLGSITKIRTGKLDANAASDDGQYPFFTCSQDILRISTYSYDCECVLVAGNGDLNVKYYNGKFDAYQRTYIIENNFDSNLSMRYLYYFLKSYVHTLRRQSIGGVIKYIKLENLTEADLPLPNISIQNEIVEKLDRVSELIIKRNQQLAKLDTLVKSRFIEMFGRKQFPKMKAAEVCDFITKGTTPSTKDILSDESSETVPYLKVYNLSKTGELLFHQQPQYISREIHEGQLARSKVYPNDVLMNIVGPPLGKFALIPNDYSEWNINQAIAIFRAKERILPKFLLTALMQEEVLRPFIDQAVGIRQLNLSLEQCRNLELILPPLTDQERFVSFVAQVDKSKSVLQKLLEKQELLRAALMQEYFG